jgi:hypothetical protein
MRGWNWHCWMIRWKMRSWNWCCRMISLEWEQEPTLWIHWVIFQWSVPSLWVVSGVAWVLQPWFHISEPDSWQGGRGVGEGYYVSSRSFLLLVPLLHMCVLQLFSHTLSVSRVLIFFWLPSNLHRGPMVWCLHPWKISLQNLTSLPRCWGPIQVVLDTSMM